MTDQSVTFAGLRAKWREKRVRFEEVADSQVTAATLEAEVEFTLRQCADDLERLERLVEELPTYSYPTLLDSDERYVKLSDVTALLGKGEQG